MPLPSNNTNPIIQRLRSDGIISPASGPLSTRSKLEQGMQGTFSALRGPLPQDSAPGPFGGGMAPAAEPAQPPLTVFGGGMSPSETRTAAALPLATQVAGSLATIDEQGQVSAFQQRLKDAGVNLDPTGQAPGDFQQSMTAARGIYDTVFGGGMSKTSGPVQAFAPTGLRDRAMAAGGGGVWGTGDVMAFSDGPNAQGGQSFSLGQVRPVGGPNATAMQPANPVAPSSAGLSRLPQAGNPSAYQTNADTFRNHIVTQQMQAGLSKGLEPGYMVDPDRPNAVKPIPGSMAELKLQKEKQEVREGEVAKGEKTRQTVENSKNVLAVIDRVLPRISSKTTGWGSILKEVPATEAKEVATDIETINANLGVDRMLEMRAAALDGSSGLGPLTEREFTRLVASRRSLDQAQSPEMVRENINAIKDSYQKLNLLAQGINPDETGGLAADKRARLTELRAKKAARESAAK